MSAAGLRVQQVLRRPGGFTLDVDLALPGSGITALFGASGSGKTTLLRCVAGLERAGGVVHVAGSDWQDDARGLFVPTWQRSLGYVFQEASLFDHLDVAGNLAYARRRSRSGAVGGLGLAAAVELLGIGHVLRSRPAQLSGGERQRVAIARALATDPRVLLLDEPLASLDAPRRQELLPWLERLRDESRIPMLYVTHSLDEVARLADTLVVLAQGRVLAVGPADQGLVRLDLQGQWGEDAGALLHAEVVGRDPQWHLAQVAFPGGDLWLADPGLPPGAAVRVRVLARDISLALVPPGPSSIQNVLRCEVRAIAPAAHPSQTLVQLACGPTLLAARITARAVHDLHLAPGREVWAQVKSVAVVR